MEKVLVTGGAGFIGQNIVRRLLEDGKEVTIIDNLSTGKKEVIDSFTAAAKGTKFYQENTETLPVEKYSDPDIDTIFHFGSPCSVQQFRKDPSKPMNETIIGFMKVMELARSTGSTVIFPSSGSIYGNKKELQSEADEPEPANLYGIGKVTVEALGRYYRRVYGIKCMGMRIFAGYGPGEEHKGEIASAITIFMNQIIRGIKPEIWGDGKQRRDFVYISDVVDMALKCAQQQKAEVINVGSGESVTFNDIIGLLNSSLGKDIDPLYIPKPANYLEYTKADISLSRELYHFNPTPVSKGIGEYVEYSVRVQDR